jgi:hypothetical protein
MSSERSSTASATLDRSARLPQPAPTWANLPRSRFAGRSVEPPTFRRARLQCPIPSGPHAASPTSDKDAGRRGALIVRGRFQPVVCLRLRRLT